MIYEGANSFSQFHQITESLPELCEKIKVFKGLIPRKRTTKKCAEPLWNRVNRKELQYEDEKDMLQDTDEEWGLKHMLKNLEKRLNEGRETIIIKLLKFMTKENEPQSRTSIQDKCGCLNWSNYTVWNKRQVAYKILSQVSDNLWKVNPIVFEAIQQNRSLYNKIFE